MEIKIIKEKNGVPTVIEYQGKRYVLDHPNHYNRGTKK
jgi:hypothetical protein